MCIIVVESALLDQFTLSKPIFFLEVICYSALCLPVPIDQECIMAIWFFSNPDAVHIYFLVENCFRVLGMVNSCHSVRVAFLHKPSQAGFLELGWIFLL